MCVQRCVIGRRSPCGGCEQAGSLVLSIDFRSELPRGLNCRGCGGLVITICPKVASRKINTALISARHAAGFRELPHGFGTDRGQGGMLRRFRRGDIVVVARQKFSTSPGPRAREVSPASSGDSYSYIVDKFWLVKSCEDGELRLLTRTGKEHVISADDFRVRKPTIWERLFSRTRFPSRELLTDASSEAERPADGH